MPPHDRSPLDEALAAAHDHWRAGRNADASRLVDAILGEHPRDPGALHLRGLLALAQDDVEGAWRDLATALSMRPDFEGWLNLAVVFHARRRPLEAQHAAKCAVALSGGDPRALLQLGAVEQEFGDAASAEAHYRAAIAANPALVEA
ncbi:MAG: tetratricopeptide repeat protein, partial [Tagaea sp.]|nr:tetratricopeptide repeat protein [Tagaea sp.]